MHRVIKAELGGTHYKLPALPTPGEAEAKMAKRLASRVVAPSKKPRKRAAAKEVQAWEAAGLHCSANERRADEASRDVEAWLKCKFMRDHLGEEYSGAVTAATTFGIFVTLDALYVEGLVHISELGGDYFRFDEARQELRGERSGIRYQIGTRVRVQVSRVDLDGRRIEFRLIRDNEDLPVRSNKAPNRDANRANTNNAPSREQRNDTGSSDKWSRRDAKGKSKRARRNADKQQRTAMPHMPHVPQAPAPMSTPAPVPAPAPAMLDLVKLEAEYAQALPAKHTGKAKPAKEAAKQTIQQAVKQPEQEVQVVAKPPAPEVAKRPAKKATKQVTTAAVKTTASAPAKPAAPAAKTKAPATPAASVKPAAAPAPAAAKPAPARSTKPKVAKTPKAAKPTSAATADTKTVPAKKSSKAPTATAAAKASKTEKQTSRSKPPAPSANPKASRKSD